MTQNQAPTTSESGVKRHIREVVEEYKRVFVDDYKGTCEEAHLMRGKVDEFNPFGDMTKKTDTIQRVLTCTSEVMENIIKMKLSEDDYKWYRTNEGGRWFGRAFPEFLITKSI